jgi:hypothetical protein
VKKNIMKEVKNSRFSKRVEVKNNEGLSNAEILAKRELKIAEALKEEENKIKAYRQLVYMTRPAEKFSVEEKIKEALKYSLLWNWNKTMTCITACISRPTLDLHLKKFEENSLSDDRPTEQRIEEYESTFGRPPRLTDRQANKVNDIITEKGMTFDSVKINSSLDDPDSFANICLKVIADDSLNPLYEQPMPDPKTVKVWQEQVNGFVRKADKKSTGRQAALVNIRKQLSLMCALPVLYEIIDPEMLFSTDDVSILVHKSMDDEKPKVITTEEAIKWLKAAGLSVSHLDNDFYCQRLVQFSLTLAGGNSGKVPCKVIKICDYQFNVENPQLFKMPEQIYVLCYHPKTDKTELASLVYRRAICPEICEYRKKLISRELTRFRAIRDDVPSQSQESHQVTIIRITSLKISV